MGRQRSRSPRRRSPQGDGDATTPSVLDDGRDIASILAMSTPKGLLVARATQLAKCGIHSGRASRLMQGLRLLWQRLRRWRPFPKEQELPPSEKASRLLLACWAAVCSWDPGFVATEAWEQVSHEVSGPCGLRLVTALVEEVSSIFGLWSLLQVVKMAPESEEQCAVKDAVTRQMHKRWSCSGATCPVCLEELGTEAVLVMPCGHAVHFPCYASAVRAKACAGRCLMCRKVCNWSNVIISKLLEDFRGWMVTMTTEEVASLPDAADALMLGVLMPPPEFLMASVCADLSEHLPYLLEVSMTISSFIRLFKSSSIEISPHGSWMVTEKLDLWNAGRGARGTLVGPGMEAIMDPPPRYGSSVTLPVAATLVSISSLDGKVCYNEFQLQTAAAFTPQTLFGLLGAAGEARLTWKVPLPMKLFWTKALHQRFSDAGMSLCEETVHELLERPELEIFGRLSLFEDESEDNDPDNV
eukprot:symbB.v1.2.000428.t1/scaffold32.1/size405148/1